MYKKVSVVLGALALVAVASQAFVVAPADAREHKKFVCHESKPGKFKVIAVGSQAALDEHVDNTGEHDSANDFETNAAGTMPPCPPA